MAKIDFFEHIGGKKIRYVVVAAQENGKWLYVRQRARRTWEIPGGHVEPGETPRQAANRELYEETGVTKSQMQRVCVYSAAGQDIVKDGLVQSYGVLYYACVQERGPLPQSEIAEVRQVEQMPPLTQLTYPLIQPFLQKRTELFLQMRYGAH